MYFTIFIAYNLERKTLDKSKKGKCMTILLPIKVFLGGLAIIVSLASAAQAGRPLINSHQNCHLLSQIEPGLKWGGKGEYKTRGCYYYSKGKYKNKVYWGGHSFANFYTNADIGCPTCKDKVGDGKRRLDMICRVGWKSWYNARARGAVSTIGRRGKNIKCDCINNNSEKVFGFRDCKP